jgi:transposase
VKYRKVLDGVLYIPRIGCQWKMISKEKGSDLICYRRYQEWNNFDVFKNKWIKPIKFKIKR